MYAIRSYYVHQKIVLKGPGVAVGVPVVVITSYSIHYTKLYEESAPGVKSEEKLKAVFNMIHTSLVG